jgi:RNA polymerase sigma-70 factor (ECF subfamily)
MQHVRGAAQEELLLRSTFMSQERLFAELASPLRAFVARRAPPGADVEDLVQTIWLRMHQSLSTLRDPERAGAWMFQIARNVIADAGRSLARAKTDELDETEHAMPEGDGEAASHAAARCLVPMIQELEEPYRTALQLIEMERLTHVQAAERAQVSQAAMKSRVLRGRAALRTVLLRCCRVALDARRRVVDFERRSPASCSGCAPECSENPR